MKAISLWQPWASLVVSGAKRIETRSWFTPYRGPLVIHAAKRFNKAEVDEINRNHPYFATALAGVAIKDLPYGALIGTVRLVDCVETRYLAGSNQQLDAHRYAPDGSNWTGKGYWTERQLGNYEAGRYAWVFEEPKAFHKPIPYKGSQGFFIVDDVPYAVREAAL